MLLWIVAYFLMITESNAQTYLDATARTQQFNSHPSYGLENYPNNYSAEWYITSIYENTTVEVSVTTCDIENFVTAKGGHIVCQWDWDLLAIYDEHERHELGYSVMGQPIVTQNGNDTVKTYLQSTCCNGSVTALRSLGSSIYVRFTTDLDVNKTGFQMSYAAYGYVEITTEYATTVVTGNVQASSDNQGGSSNTSTNTTAITVGVVFAVLAIVVIIVAVILYTKFHKKEEQKSPEEPESQPRIRRTQIQPETSNQSKINGEPVLDTKNDLPTWARGKY